MGVTTLLIAGGGPPIPVLRRVIFYSYKWPYNQWVTGVLFKVVGHKVGPYKSRS